jgi:hypothetical protein
MKHLILVSNREPTAQDRRLLTFAAAMGVSTATVPTVHGSGLIRRLFDEFQPGTYSLAMSVETLTAVMKASTSGPDLQTFLNECSTELLIFGCTGSSEHQRALSLLTDGAITGLRPLGDHTARFVLTPQAMSLSRQLAGLSFSGGDGDLISTFDLRNSMLVAEVIMTANERPMFIRMNRGSWHIFLLAGPLPDLDQPLSRRHGLEEHYDSLIPPLLFLRYCFQESCWHAPESTARIIIDDPLLSETYGFLDYRVLMNSMERSHYGTSIAFIPWNSWRTSRYDAARLLGDSNLSICVHGCDHTNREFEERSPAILYRKASLAMRRMELHRRRTGAAFGPVMVFPQGRFSKAAIPALRANNYLAAVNTTCFPTDNDPDDLKVGDFLRPAVTRYNGFPMFQRRYPRHVFDFAFDLFLGKPALVVEHHEYFREGCGALEEFVAALYKLEPALSWPTLTAQLTRSCLKRSLPNGSVEVQFFTRRFQLANDKRGSDRFLLNKQEPDSAAIQSVLVDGANAPFSFENGFLKLEVQAGPGQVRNIEIVDREQPHEQANGFGVVHNTGVLIRRGLSEFRDNTLARHGGLLKVAKGVARVLKVTGNA